MDILLAGVNGASGAHVVDQAAAARDHGPDLLGNREPRLGRAPCPGGGTGPVLRPSGPGGISVALPSRAGRPAPMSSTPMLPKGLPNVT